MYFLSQDFRTCLNNSNLHYPSYDNQENDVPIDFITFQSNFSELCEKQPLFHGCLDNFTQSIVKYSHADEIYLITSVHNIAKQLFNYTCSDGGTTIYKLRYGRYNQCYPVTNVKIRRCLRFAARQFSEDYEGVIESISRKMCVNLSDAGHMIRNCVIRNLETCSEYLATVFENIFEIANDELACNQSNNV